MKRTVEFITKDPAEAGQAAKSTKNGNNDNERPATDYTDDTDYRQRHGNLGTNSDRNRPRSEPPSGTEDKR
jgi:hypothetical protein